jgi:hypothetical protein
MYHSPTIKLPKINYFPMFSKIRTKPWIP